MEPALTVYRDAAAPKKKKIIAFGWYGGKYSHLNWLLPLLPKTLHYCEPAEILWANF